MRMHLVCWAKGTLPIQPRWSSGKASVSRETDLSVIVGTIRRMRCTTQWGAAFRVKSFKAAVIRRQWLGEEGGEERWW